MKEYKVLTQKDKWFSGKADPETLETVLNNYAKEGWKVVNSVSMSVASFSLGQNELMIILERDKTE